MPDDRELGVPVRPGNSCLEQVALVDELLEGELPETVHDARLDADDVIAVLERPRRIAVGDAASQLIQDREAEPDRSWRPRSDQPRGK